MGESPTWYDLLDLPRDASTAEIRAAWKSQIADLDPGDRRFDALNRAARVLLDPGARTAYDATLIEEEATTSDGPAEASTSDGALVEEGALAPVTKPAGKPGLVTRLRRSSTSDGPAEASTSDGPAEASTSDGPAGASTSDGPAEASTSDGPAEASTSDGPLVEEGALAPVTKPAGKPGLVTRLRRSSTSDGPAEASTSDGGGDKADGIPTWLLAGLGIVAGVLIAATAWMWLRDGEGGDEAARAAQTAAERAVVPVLSYDFKTLEADREAAKAQMTGRYSTEYDKLFALIEENAPETETRVGAEVVASGIVRASDERVQVLVFVDRPTTNRLSAEPTVYKDQVTLSMQLVDGVWLVDDMVTSPVQG